MNKNNIILGLIGITGTFFSSAVLVSELNSAAKLTGLGVILGISTLFVYNLIKEKTNG